MSVVSKIVDLNLRNLSCRTILHPGQTCVEALIQNLFTCTLSTFKFYLPMILIQLAMKTKKINRKMILDRIKFYIELSIGTSCLGIGASGFLCLYRLILGRFYYHTIIVIPSLTAVLISLGFSDRFARLLASTVLQVIIEAYLRKKTNTISRTISESKLFQTFLFMISSSIILNILKNNKKLNVFWFMKPIQYQNLINENESVEEICTPIENLKKSIKCNHNGSCVNFSFQGIKSYFLIGFALETVKMIVGKPKEKSNNLYNFVLNKMRNFDFNSLKFLVSYVGFYRVSNCLFNKYLNINSNTIHLLSGLLGGISYIFYPKQLFLVYAITIALELLWSQYTKKTNKTKFEKMVLKLCIPQMIIVPSLTLVIHWYIFRKNLINPIGMKICNAATNHRISEVHDRLKALVSEYHFK